MRYCYFIAELSRWNVFKSLRKLVYLLCLSTLSWASLASDVQLTSLGDTKNETVARGGQVIYDVVFKNIDAATANDVSILFTFPATTSFVSTSIRGCAAVTAQNTVRCNIGTMVGDSSQSGEFVIQTSKSTGDAVTFQAEIEASNELPGTGNNNVAEQITSVVAGADLQVVTSAPNTVYVGDAFDYQVTVKNQGPNLASNVTLEHTLPSLATWNKNASVTTGWACAPLGQKVQCTRRELDVDTTSTLKINATLSGLASGNVTGASVIAAQTQDGNNSNNNDSVVSRVLQQTDLALSMFTTTGSSRVDWEHTRKVGEGFNFVFEVSNKGHFADKNTEVVVDFNTNINVNLSQYRFTGNDAANWSCRAEGYRLLCQTSSTFAAKSSVTLTVPAKVERIFNRISTRAYVTAKAIYEPNVSNNNDSIIISSEDQRVRTAKSVLNKPAGAAFVLNETVKFQIRTTVDDPDVEISQLRDTLDPALRFVSVTSEHWNCAEASKVITCTPKSNVGNHPRTMDVIIESTLISNASTTVSNTAYVNAIGKTLSASTSINVQPPAPELPDLTVSKTSDYEWSAYRSAKPEMGSILTYTFKITNSNTGATARNLTLTDTFENFDVLERVEVPQSNGSSTILTLNAEGGSCDFDLSSRLLSCERAELAPGATWTVSVPVRALFKPTSYSVNNIAWLSYTGATGAGLELKYAPWNLNLLNNLSLQLHKAKSSSQSNSISTELATGPVTENGLIYNYFVVKNNSQVTTPGVISVSHTLSTKERFVETKNNYGTNWQCQQTSAANISHGGIVSCEYKDSGNTLNIAPGKQSTLLAIQTRAVAIGVIESTAVARDALAQRQSEVVTRSIKAAQSADLSIRSNAPDTLLANTATITYQLTAKNESGSDIDSQQGGQVEIVSQFKSAYFKKYTSPTSNITTINQTGFSVPKQVTASMGAIFNCDDSAVINAQTKNITCRLASGSKFKVGETLQVDVEVSRPFSVPAGKITNTATIATTSHSDANTANNTATSVTTTRSLYNLVLLSNAITPNKVYSGDRAIQTIEVGNFGALSATNVYVTHVLDAQAGELVRLLSLPPTCSEIEGGVSCAIGTLAPGEVKTLEIHLRGKSSPTKQAWDLNTISVVASQQMRAADVRANTTIIDENEWSVTDNRKVNKLIINPRMVNLKVEVNENRDPLPWFAQPTNTQNNSLSAVNQRLSSALNTASNQEAKDNRLVYQVDLEYLSDNQGGLSVASGVRYSFTMNPGSNAELQFLCDSDNPKSCSNQTNRCDNLAAVIKSTTSIQCQGPLNAGSATLDENDLQESLNSTGSATQKNIYRRYMHFKALVQPKDTADVVHNTVTVTSNESEESTTDNTIPVTTSIRVAVDLAIQKTVSKSEVALNEVFTYTLDVVNQGPGDAVNNTIFDVLPEYLELVGTPTIGGTNCVVDSVDSKTRIRCSNDRLNAGESVQAKISVKAKSQPSDKTLTNTATVETDGADTNLANNTSTISNKVNDTLIANVISGRVFVDTLAANGKPDGQYQDTEKALKDIKVVLSWQAGGTTQTREVLTSASGEYRFDNLPEVAEGYTVTQPDTISGYLAGRSYVDNSTEGVAKNNITGLTFTTNSARVVNFTKLQAGSISGRVFVDTLAANGKPDGQYQDTEKALKDIKVVLSWQAGGTTQTREVLTSASGEYRFDNLPEVAEGYTVTQPDTISGYLAGRSYVDNSTEGVAKNNITGLTFTTNSARVVNFTKLQAGSISGRVFVDTLAANGKPDGQYQDTEKALKDIKVVLSWQAGGTTQTREVLTSASGEYRFDNLPEVAEGYTVTQPDTISGYLAGRSYVDNSTEGVAKNNITGLTFTTNSARVVNFTKLQAGSISGRVFVDTLAANGKPDGQYQDTEKALKDIKVVLSWQAGGTTQTREVLTSASGEYRFDNLPEVAEGYTVTQPDTISGYLAGRSYVDNSAEGVAKNNITGLTFTTNSARVVNFTKLQAGSISGRVFVDTLAANGKPDGQYQDTEKALKDIKVVLSWQAGGTTQTREVLTSASGEYRFDNLPEVAEGYTVTQPDTISGYLAGRSYVDNSTEGVAKNNITGLTFTTNSARVVNFTKLQAGSISGRVFVDTLAANGKPDGQYQDTEKALKDIKVVLSWQAGGTTQTREVLTSASGEYRFDNLPEVAEGYTVTQPDTISGYLAGRSYVDNSTEGVAKNNITGLTFTTNSARVVNFTKLQAGSISGRVFVDTLAANGKPDGQYQDTEIALSGIVLILSGQDVFGNSVKVEKRTDNDGLYQFNDLLPADSDSYTLIQEYVEEDAGYMDGSNYVRNNTPPLLFLT
ncbi:DUF11 domain-containing protein [Pseudoalteromonas piscicida]|uniref:DUF11 domain-containing protein n=1 Tax=Pseudoalteromonas piscicida TaxID=43662 RepID=A0AAD0W2J1_PSEO7|nr:DUF11 domain-containing protein [Pseudoalteromonas piscicida]